MDSVRAQSYADADWWHKDWCHRIKLTFDNLTSQQDLVNQPDLINFPVLVKLNTQRIDYDKVQDQGQDLRFVDADNQTLLAHEIEAWNEQGDSFIWVKAPQIDKLSNSDFIYLYYGNNAINDGQDSSGVWDADYVMVQHLGEDLHQPDPVFKDSTVNQNHAVDHGSMTLDDQIEGMIDGAVDFDGQDDQLIVTDNQTLDITQAITVEAWINGSQRWRERIVSKGGERYVLRRDEGNEDGSYLHGYLSKNGSLYHAKSATKIIANNQNYYVVLTWDGGSGDHRIRLYNNGFEIGDYSIQQDLTAPLDTSDHNLFIGSHDGEEYWQGILDEVRISKTARSASWIQAQYRSMIDEFVIFGDQITHPDCLECVPQEQWWDIDWNYRTKLTFNNSASQQDLINFPVLVKLNTQRIDYDKVQNQGQDLRFVDADNQTVLAHEIEAWNEQGDSFIWVKAPQVNGLSIDDFMYVYYGNFAALDGQDKQATWSNSYAGVWHLNESPTHNGTHFDVSANGNYGTFIDPNASSQTNVEGKIAGADEFRGADGDRVYIGDPPDGSLDFGGNSFSYSVWVYVEAGNARWDTAWYKGGSSCLAGFAKSTLSWDCDSLPAGGQGDVSFKVKVE